MRGRSWRGFFLLSSVIICSSQEKHIKEGSATKKDAGVLFSASTGAVQTDKNSARALISAEDNNYNKKKKKQRSDHR